MTMAASYLLARIDIAFRQRITYQQVGGMTFIHIRPSATRRKIVISWCMSYRP